MKQRPFLFFLCLALSIVFTACGSTEIKSTNSDESQATESNNNQDTKTPDEKQATKDGVQVGDKAPAFELIGTDDQKYSFDNIMDANGQSPKGFVVTFTCNTCPYAVMYEDRLIALHNSLSPKGYPVVAIMPNDTDIKPDDNLDAMKVRATEKGFPFPYLIDEGQEVYPQYGASRTPEVYLVDSEGVVRYHGAIDDNAQDAEAVTVNYVEKAVAAVEAGQDPDPADVKAIGCTIKTK